MNEICEILIRINQLEFEQGGKSKVKIGPSRLPASTKRLKTSAFTVSSCSFSKNEFVNLPWPILSRHSQQRTNPQWPGNSSKSVHFLVAMESVDLKRELISKLDVI